MGFTFVFDNCNGKPQCVLCCFFLSNEAIKPSKLKRYLQQKHLEYVEKDLDFFERLKLLLKGQKLDTTGYFQEQITAS